MRFFALGMLVLVLVPATASAQAMRSKPPPQTFTLTKQHHTAAEDTARARFAAGDCKGALDMFDQALEHSTDPTLYRDRGICHDKLGNAFPAIDDYRTYLAAMPQATDADQIQERLAKLEGRASPKETGDDDASVKAARKGRTLTEIERERDRRYEAEDSSVRLGKGFVIGGLIHLRAVGQKFFQFGQRAGATVRYSLDAHNTIMTELGWSWLDADRPSGSSGPMAFLGYELRLAIDDYGTHSILFGAGLGFERFVQNATNAASNGMIPRGRLGYRLVLGKSFGIEATFDAGALVAWAEAGGGAQVLASVGGGAGFVVGF